MRRARSLQRFERATLMIPPPLYAVLATITLAVATIARAGWTERGWIRQLTALAGVPAT